MSNRIASRFDEELYKLFEARTFALKASVWPVPGRENKITRKKILKGIDRLGALAEQNLLRSRRIRKILREADYKKQWHLKNKGHGRPAKRRSFKAWYDKNITTKNCVYAFWKGKKCLYAGRTLNGKGRPTHHFDKHWFGNTSRIDVYAFDRKRDVPRFECLLTHRAIPAYSRMKPSSKKFYSQCPICQAQKTIRKEVKSLFRLR